MTKAITYNDLADKVEAASGPDQELDAEIAVAVSNEPTARIVWGKGKRWYRSSAHGRIPFAGAFGKGVKLGLYYQTVRYTASLDAALSLVPEGWGFQIMPRMAVVRHPQQSPLDCESYGKTPALALVAACLRAHAEGEG